MGGLLKDDVGKEAGVTQKAQLFYGTLVYCWLREHWSELMCCGSTIVVGWLLHYWTEQWVWSISLA